MGWDLVRRARRQVLWTTLLGTLSACSDCGPRAIPTCVALGFSGGTVAVDSDGRDDVSACAPSPQRVAAVFFVPWDTMIEQVDRSQIEASLATARRYFANNSRLGMTFAVAAPTRFMSGARRAAEYCEALPCGDAPWDAVHAELLTLELLQPDTITVVFTRGLGSLAMGREDLVVLGDPSAVLSEQLIAQLSAAFGIADGTPAGLAALTGSPWLTHPATDASLPTIPVGTSSLPIAIARSAQLDGAGAYVIASSSILSVDDAGLLSSTDRASVDFFPEAAFEIRGARDVVLDCRGAHIRPDDIARADAALAPNDAPETGVGIRVVDSEDVIVRNCHVSGYRYGILVEDSTNVIIEGNTSTHNYRKFTAGFFGDGAVIDGEHFGGGIRVMRSSHVSLVGNQGEEQMTGIELMDVTSALVQDNRFNFDQVSLYMRQSSRNHVVHNDFDWGLRVEIRTCSGSCPGGVDQILERGGPRQLMAAGLLLVDELGTTPDGLELKRLLRLFDRDTPNPFWALANYTEDAAGVLVEDESHENFIGKNSMSYGGDGLFIRANATPCSLGNLIVENEAAYSPNNGLELSFCSAVFEGNLVFANDHGMWLGAGAHDTLLQANRYAYNYSYDILGTRTERLQLVDNVFEHTPVAIAMKDEQWGGNLNLPPDDAPEPSTDWAVTGNTFRAVNASEAHALVDPAASAVFQLSGTLRFTATDNTYEDPITRCQLPHPESSAPNEELSLDCP
jgi:parallel beta-helix repeat protein